MSHSNEKLHAPKLFEATWREVFSLLLATKYKQDIAWAKNQIIVVIVEERLKDNFLKAGICHKIQLSTYCDKSSKDAQIPLKIEGS